MPQPELPRNQMNYRHWRHVALAFLFLNAAVFFWTN
jgi:hypothetical protein